MSPETRKRRKPTAQNAIGYFAVTRRAEPPADKPAPTSETRTAAERPSLKRPPR